MRSETKQAFIGPAVFTALGLVSKFEKSLSPGEQVKAVAVVTHKRAGAIIAITDQRVVVRSSAARPFAGEWPLGAVSSMQATGGIIGGGKLTVTVADGAVEVGVKLKTAEAVARVFRDVKAAAGVSGAPVGGSSAADELAKFGQLFRDGLISQAEFDAKKAELLRS